MRASLCTSVCALVAVAAVVCRQAHGRSLGTNNSHGDTKSVYGKSLTLCRDIFHLDEQCQRGSVTDSRCDGIEDKVAFCLNGDRRLGDTHDKTESAHSKALILCRDIFRLADECRNGTVTDSRCDGIEDQVAFCLNGDRRLDDSHDKTESAHDKVLILCRDIFHLSDQCQAGTVTGSSCKGIEHKVAFCLNGDRRLDDSHGKTESVNGKGLILCQDILHLADQCRDGTLTRSRCEGNEAKVAFCLNGGRRLRGSLRNLAFV